MRAQARGIPSIVEILFTHPPIFISRSLSNQPIVRAGDDVLLVEADAADQACVAFQCVQAEARLDRPHLDPLQMRGFKEGRGGGGSGKTIHSFIHSFIHSSVLLFVFLPTSSEEPLTMYFPRYCKQAIPRSWPLRTRCRQPDSVSQMLFYCI